MKDLETLQTETSKLRTQYLGTLTPTAEETTLATTIADFQEQMKNYDLETQKKLFMDLRDKEEVLFQDL